MLMAIAFLCAVIFAPTHAFADEGDDSTSSSTVAAPIAGPVPNIIVTNFTYGGDSVAAGAKFDLAFTFQNKGQVAVTNMVVTVDGGESFAIAGGTNTFYVDALWAGYSLTQTVPMQALASAKSGAQPVSISFKYEYLDSGARSSTQSDIKISVPISQPDRFEVSDPVLPDQSIAGQEATITMEYVNKGKGDISNVEATMEGEGFDATMKNQYVGNVTSGATGSIGYAFTPQAAGELSATVKVTYEDSDGQSKTKEFPVKITVADAPVMDGTAVDDMTVEPAGPVVPIWAWVAGAVAVVVLIVVIVLLVRRHRKKKSKSKIDEEWDDWAEGDANKGDAAANGTDARADAASSASAGAAAAAGASPSDSAPTTVLEPVSAVDSPAPIAADSTAHSK
ncbi:COG1361 S-layer family protein [Bifidobacterium felsineum]|uniref:ABC transporter permease n=1 Tax=Bifidobacterium felsineum TaxID=2045440 RepID=A0A2M9HJM2_9BIFI|nr:ABC transporter permease [Bifidobacterium felsineum]PJM77001.1 ABC transporter permease [Bifidobacterium felsineum]